MLRNVFTKALWDARRSLFGWTLAVAAVGAMYAASWSSFNNPDLLKAMDSIPSGVMETFNYTNMSSPSGYLAGSVYGLLVPLLMSVFTIAAGTRAIAGDEQAGTLDLVLAHPVGRVRLALQRFAAIAVGIVLVASVLGLVMVAIAGPAQLTGITAADLGAITLHLILFGATFGALAFAIGAITGRRALTLGLTAGLAVLAYLLNSIISQVKGLEWVREGSPWRWYLGNEPLVNGVQAGHCLLLAAATAVLLALGTLAFTRRDIATA